jgi:tRNA modification GTPase
VTAGRVILTVIQNDQTIVAPATAAGEGGIGIVRISGSLALTTLLRFFTPSSPFKQPQTHQLYHGHLHTPDGRLVDEVMAVYMRGPKSYTGEDVVEVNCHGGQLIVRRVLDLFLDAGLSMAQPGEFTLRAFFNGRIDLSQAEAVIDVIRSRSDAAAQVALRQMDGVLSRQVYHFREQIIDVLALVEAHIDFPEEEIDPPAVARIKTTVTAIIANIDSILQTFDHGRVLREGVNVLILGRPNVGKSSLLNALLGEARAIVTELPGTTRDTIEESLVVDGIPVRIIDTAGVRDTTDVVEAEGVRRAREKCQTADIVLLVVDGSRQLTSDDDLALDASVGRQTVLVVNKSDRDQVELPERFATLNKVSVSTKTHAGFDRLHKLIVEPFSGGGEVSESTLISDRRHREALLRCNEALNRFLVCVETEQSPEFLSFELRDSLSALGEITGETTPDEILDQIFSKFCIGK